MCFGKKRPQLTEKSSVRTGRLLTNGGQWDSYSGAKEYFGTFKITALNWKTLEALGCDIPLSLPIRACWCYNRERYVSCSLEFMSYIKLYTVFILTTKLGSMPLQNKQSVFFFHFSFHFLIKYCADLFSFVNMDITFFLWENTCIRFVVFSGRQLAVCTPCRNQQWLCTLRHVCAFY